MSNTLNIEKEILVSIVNAYAGDFKDKETGKDVAYQKAEVFALKENNLPIQQYNFTFDRANLQNLEHTVEEGKPVLAKVQFQLTQGKQGMYAKGKILSVRPVK